MKIAESEIQKQIFRAVAYAKNVNPKLGRLFHIPNGEKRNIQTAMKLKAMGVMPGVPDLFLPVPNEAGRHGLWIEVKAGKNRLTENQKLFVSRTLDDGYDFAEVRSVEEFFKVVSEYLQDDRLSDFYIGRNAG